MKACLLSIADEFTDHAVRAARADLLAEHLVTLESERDNALSRPTKAVVEADILQARQQPGVSLAEAKSRFGL